MKHVHIYILSFSFYKCLVLYGPWTTSEFWTVGWSYLTFFAHIYSQMVQQKAGGSWINVVTRKLSHKDCAPLIDKLKARINCWSSKLLTYAGRLQLVKFVLYSIQNFWSRHFFLPKGTLKKANRLCSGFLWKGNE